MNQPAVRNDPMKPLLATMTQYKAQIEAALPRHTIDPQRIVRMFVSQVRKVPQLAACDPVSVVGSIVRVAQLGIDPERAYLIPYKTECNVIIDYRGLCDLVRRHPDVDDVWAEAVYDGDEFDVELGSDQRLVHKPKWKGKRGEPIAFYAVGKFTNGRSRFVVMSKEEVEEHRDKFSNKNSPAWKNSFVEMAKKTVTRRLCKTMPQTSEVIQVEAMENTIDDGSQANHMILDAEHVPELNKSADATTIAQINAEEKADRVEDERKKLINAVMARAAELQQEHKVPPAAIEERIGTKIAELGKCTSEQLAAMLEALA